MNDKQLEEVQEAIGYIFDAEPPEVQEALAETVVPPTLLTIIKKHNVPLHKSEGLKNHIYLVLFNVQTMDDVREWLSEQCRLPEEDVEAAVSDIEQMVLIRIQRIRTKLVSKNLSETQKKREDAHEDAGEDDGYRETIG